MPRSAAEPCSLLSWADVWAGTCYHMVPPPSCYCTGMLLGFILVQLEEVDTRCCPSLFMSVLQTLHNVHTQCYST